MRPLKRTELSFLRSPLCLKLPLSVTYRVHRVPFLLDREGRWQDLPFLRPCSMRCTVKVVVASSDTR